jgi:iron uptake system component EfeO
MFAGAKLRRRSRRTDRHRRHDSRAFLQLSVFGIALTAALPAKAGPFDEAVERYRPYLIADIDAALAGARDVRARLTAQDVVGARKAWIDARVGWERSEVFTAVFVPRLDAAIDAWPDAVSGFHGVEANLFGGDPSDASAATDALIADLADLDARIRTLQLTPEGLLDGVARLAYEVGDSKVDGGESRISGTSLNDMRNNVDGIDLAYRTLFATTLGPADPKLAEQVGSEIAQLKRLLSVPDLKSVDADALRNASETLIVSLQAAAPKIGLAMPTLEDTGQ